MESSKSKSASKWRIPTFIVIGVMIGLFLAPTSVYSHVGGAVRHLWKEHIKPKTDARYPTESELASNGGAGVHYGNLTNVPSDGLLKATSIDVTCEEDVSVGTSFGKVQDIGSFTKETGNSIIEVTFHGRLGIGEITGAQGAVFELRVDDAAPGDGRARAVVRPNSEINASMTGIFRGLSPGAHDVSMWVRVPTGSGEGAQLDGGCWATDHVVVNEFR